MQIMMLIELIDGFILVIILSRLLINCKQIIIYIILLKLVILTGLLLFFILLLSLISILAHKPVRDEFPHGPLQSILCQHLQPIFYAISIYSILHIIVNISPSHCIL